MRSNFIIPNEWVTSAFAGVPLIGSALFLLNNERSSCKNRLLVIYCIYHATELLS